jgi:hypothetical protein
MFFDILISLVIFFLCSGFTICLFTLNPTFLIIWLIVLRILLRGIFFIILNSWIRYAVILLFTGGIIVLFRYILSLITSSKIRFFYSPKIILIFWVTITIFFTRSNTYKRIFITSLFFQTRNILLIILALYLLIVLLSIVNIARSNSGPIKSFFTYDQ